MAVISYDSEEMEQVRASYKSQNEIAQDIKKHMLEDVKIIRENWEGDDAANAQEDLNAIETQMESIAGNIETILSLVDKVMGDFAQLKYQAGGEKNG